MHSSKTLAVLLIVGATILTSHSLPYREELSDEDDDRLNEVSGEWGSRRLVFPRLDRLFGSAEMPSGKPKRSKASSSPRVKVKRNNDRGGSGAPGDTTESSKHAHSMITSMLTFVSSVMNFGRSFVKDQ
ncbi:GL22527 [Drosophila persimilis]|uniref:GL22527 n=1 Tax=Drosophila persimilis TaxID=7234 RepID=B4H186_DROPE|nr:uncharacterized protein LOC6599466 [Drosophila persimilis]EDW30063.1 GL22527 [Drosophila persimilis]